MLLILTIPFLIAFYFLLIRPQQQRVREHEAMIAALQAGDEVVTAGGIHGTLTAVYEDRVEIEVAPELRLTLARAAIGRIEDPPVTPEGPNPADHGATDLGLGDRDPAADRDVLDHDDGDDDAVPGENLT